MQPFRGGEEASGAPVLLGDTLLSESDRALAATKLLALTGKLYRYLKDDGSWAFPETAKTATKAEQATGSFLQEAGETEGLAALVEITNGFSKPVTVKLAGEGTVQTAVLQPGTKRTFRCNPGLLSVGIRAAPDIPINSLELVAAGKSYTGVISSK